MGSNHQPDNNIIESFIKKQQECLGTSVINSTWNAKCPTFFGNFTPKTSNYFLENRALGFPGIS